MEIHQILLLLGAGLFAGTVNAIAGGGALLLYPALLGAGLAPVPANVTNSIAVSPGYLASIFGARKDLSGQAARIRAFVPTAIVGTVAGSVLLLVTPASAFEAVVPYLVIGAALLLAFQKRVQKMVGHPAQLPVWLGHVLVGAATFYGGYFGAALGVITIAVLSLVLAESLTRITALKNVITAASGLTTVAVFALFGPVNWFAVLLLTPMTLIGGFVGSKLARVLKPSVLRVVIVAWGLGAGVYLLIRG
ncbi:UPF0721 transmembrane protein [Actinorhabdospora filicis]|uniref:Probable membrane transporter protein n=1 Tax=Actinorhabdospora filicis TaxID=1785913 RepID=A0A9W6SEI6_9ACTN|nr:sulfite exporter TauE/SafE family protein [Actinorhabdospora filicis]GLZ75745.1 UPF0721 transmembrane protein [Actinorhabdospora filicis]